MISRRALVLGTASMGLAVSVRSWPAAGEEASDAWPDIRAAYFEERPIQDGAGILHLEAPKRAQDAAIVPISVVVELPQKPERWIRSVHLIVDANPAPLAGVFHFSLDSGNAGFATRVRINEYTNVRAVAEMNDGTLYMATRFVKAAGGCSAPALKDQARAMAMLGQMKLKAAAEDVPAGLRRAQLLVSHPNFSGMQFDQISRNYIPAHFVESIGIVHGDRMVLTIEGNISLSEDPSVHFNYRPEPAGDIVVEVRDSEGMSFNQRWSAPTASGS